jgi:hypothetical protein
MASFRIGFSFVSTILLLIITFAVSSGAYAVSVSELHTGDILLQPLDCYLCNAIEKLEGSIYSHSAIVVRDSVEGLFLLESLGDVHVVSFEDFVARNQKWQLLRVVRPREFATMSHENNLDSRMMNLFRARFDGLLFDNEMRWDNFGANGRELLYCSEFVAKFLENFLSQPFSTKAMHFSVLRDFWIEFFHGNVPEGLPGIAPSDFQKSQLSLDLGDLKI